MLETMYLYGITIIHDTWSSSTINLDHLLMVPIDVSNIQKEFGILSQQLSPYNEQFVDEISRRISAYTFGSNLGDRFGDVSLTCARQLRAILLKYCTQRMT